MQAPTATAAREQLERAGSPGGAPQGNGERLGRPGASNEGSTSEKTKRREKGVKTRSLQVFSRQFATMINAGLNVVTALTILEEQTDDGTSPQ